MEINIPTNNPLKIGPCGKLLVTQNTKETIDEHTCVLLWLLNAYIFTLPEKQLFNFCPCPLQKKKPHTILSRV